MAYSPPSARWGALCCALLLAQSLIAAPVADTPGHVTGVGGVFLTAKDPKALSAWYRDVLGVPIEKWGGATLRADAPKSPPKTAWYAFPVSANYFAPSSSPFMIDYAVDDMDAMLARLQAKGVTILKRDDNDASGRFTWVLDPEGNKVELWQPKMPPQSAKP